MSRRAEIRCDRLSKNLEMAPGFGPVRGNAVLIWCNWKLPGGGSHQQRARIGIQRGIGAQRHCDIASAMPDG